MKEYLKSAWDSECKYSVKSVENVTPYMISAALNFALQKDEAVYGEHCNKGWLPQRSDSEVGVGGLGRQVWKGAFSDFCLPYFN